MAVKSKTERVVSPGFYERVYRVVRTIPPGRVATYGQIAEILGHPGVARHVGNALALADKAKPKVPWHRVVNTKGLIRTKGGKQRQLLEQEGVAFSELGAVRLAAHRWSGKARR